MKTLEAVSLCDLSLSTFACSFPFVFFVAVDVEDTSDCLVKSKSFKSEYVPWFSSILVNICLAVFVWLLEVLILLYAFLSACCISVSESFFYFSKMRYFINYSFILLISRK